MAKFREEEKIRQESFRKTYLQYFTTLSQENGAYKNVSRTFALPEKCAEENLFEEIREPALQFFKEKAIKWHDGKKYGEREYKPSNHLCDSQVSCVNFLFPFSDKPSALAELLRPFFPAVNKMLPIENGRFITFEWIGKEDYLKEKASRSGKRTRGANCTSADAAVLFEDKSGNKQAVLIEWKYTEFYGRASLKKSKSGTNRVATYEPIYKKNNCLKNSKEWNFEDLFYEPLYQFMRQQFLAQEMEENKELGANIVRVLHIAPRHNLNFRNITSPKLRGLGDSATDVWKKLLKKPDRFLSLSTEELFSRFPVARFPELLNWWKYISKRYSWIEERN